MFLKGHYLHAFTASFKGDIFSSSSKQLCFFTAQAEQSSVDAVYIDKKPAEHRNLNDL